MSTNANIESVMHESRLFQPPESLVKSAAISGRAAYDAMCADAVKDDISFWANLARGHLDWHKPFTQTLDESNAPFYKWFHDGELNASYNCLDKQVNAGLGDKIAIKFESDTGDVTEITYRALLARDCRFARAIKLMTRKASTLLMILLPSTS